jgi:hypothetical protein
LTVRGCPAATDGLDGELARLQDQGTRRDGLSRIAVCQRWTYDAAFVRVVTVSDASWAVLVLSVARAVRSAASGLGGQ